MRKKIVFMFLIFFSYQAYAKIDTIIIDPGHGGRDPGAIEKRLGLKEKDVNLFIALYLRQMIKKKIPWMRVILTRSTDCYVSLQKRVQLANSYSRRKAIFISIHTNSHNKPKKVEGVEVFYYQQNPFIQQVRFKTIGSKITKNFSEPIQKPITRLVDSKTKKDAHLLAKTLAFGLKLASREPVRKIAPANFFVVGYTVLPSVLVEVGFLSSQKFLKKYYQKKIAKGILLGILRFLRKEDKF